MREFVRCLVKSNKQGLERFGQKARFEFDFSILQSENENFADVSLKITHCEKIQKEEKSLFNMIKLKANTNNLFEGNIEILQECIIGQKQHSFYFFIINEEGNNLFLKMIYVQGLLNIYTPFVNEDYVSAYRLSFEVT